ncbi:Transcriptional regulator CRZ1 [Acrodontium crateriforme]|uniref:Transcriptional regulator CRZ1 n=1 Tax=Acrodontium crateriforme TaxID=150365 RepID=A0AAQ3M6R6_9PEZI|nr:Transcriptional regulator CRZ1 [Acrodontium crateriforme]
MFLKFLKFLKFFKFLKFLFLIFLIFNVDLNKAISSEVGKDNTELPEQLGLNDEPDRGRSHSPQRGSSSVRSEASSSPVRDMINERLEMANEARANQSNSTVQESSSPFRLGSPFANEYSEGSNNSIDLTHEMLGATEHPSGHVTLPNIGVLDPEDESVKSVHEANVPEPSSSTTIHGSVADDRETPRVVPVNPTGPTQPHTLSRQSPPSQPGGDLSSNIDIDLLDFLDQTFTDEPLKNAISYRLTNSQRARDDLSAGISNNSMQDTSSKVTEGFEPPNQLPRIQPPLGFKDPWTETNKELDEQALALSAKMTATNQISARHFTSYHPQSDAFGVGDYWLCCNVRLNTIAEVLRHVEDDIGASHAGDPHSKHKARMNKDIAQLTKDILMLRKEKKLPALHGLKICFAYFTAAMRECIIMEGAEYHEYMTPEVTHLIAIHATDPKCNAAGKLGIHIVTPKWLLESVQQGMALDESLYPPDELAKQDQQQQPADFPVGNMTNGNQSGPVVELLPGVSSTNPWIIPTKAQSNSVPKEVSDAEAKATIENFFARLKAQNVTEPTSSTPSTVSKKRTHSPDKPPPNKSARRKHACSTCGAVFQRSGTRDVHERTHSDEKLFQCTVEGCDEAFKQDNERVRHEKFQHGEKRFVCGGTLPSGVSWGCGKQFRRRDGLKEHHTKTEKGKACYKARVEIPLMTSSTPS